VLRFLLGRLRMACLRGDTECQATLINCVLGTYLRAAMYTEADKFFTKVTFPTTANNNELARFVFYTGRIKVCAFLFRSMKSRVFQAMLFEYTLSEFYLAQAIRKAPQRDTTAVGFKQTVRVVFF
jgi:26S proteasome regulatory subunit N3